MLTASPARPVEGDPVTLTCETQLPPQRQDVQLRFRFYRDDQPLGFGRSWSPELRIPTVRREDSESYWCQAESRSGGHFLLQSDQKTLSNQPSKGEGLYR